mgnify:CR=1 FL=1
MLVRGSLNEILDEAHHEATAERLGADAIYTIDGVGHDLPWSAADEVNALLLELLAR